MAEFKDRTQAARLIEIGFDLSSTHVDCHPPKGYFTNVSLMGLRAYIEDNGIIAVLEKFGEIKGNVIRLKHKGDHELAGLENGNRLVSIVLNQPSIPYSLKIDGEWCRVIHSRQKPYCSTCNDFGHNRRTCKETECHKCKGKGHIAMDCPAGHGQNEKQQVTRDEETNDAKGQTTDADQETQGNELPKENDSMETDGKELGRTTNLKRAHSSTDTNTDTDTDGFKPVKPRRSKLKPTPNTQPATKSAIETIPKEQIKPPSVIKKKT